MSQKLYEENSVKAIADAIRAKNGTTTAYKVSEMAGAVADITSEPKLQLKTATPSISSQTIKPDNGYDGLSEVSISAMPAATQATPTISISTAGLITASSAQVAGYVSAGTKSSTKQMTTQATKTITPSTSNQTAVAKNVYTTGAITVKGDSNLKAENIKKGTSIFGITGTLESGGSGNTSETWVFNELIDLSEVLLGDIEKIYNIPFTSNGNSYTELKFVSEDTGDFGLYYDDTPVAGGSSESVLSFRAVSNGENYRKITFLETPDDELREFVLEYNSGGEISNAVKQPANQAIQTDKSITITSNGSTTITPDVPYDAMSKVDITVNAGGGGLEPATLTITSSVYASAYMTGLAYIDSTGNLISKAPYVNQISFPLTISTIKNGLVCLYPSGWGGIPSIPVEGSGCKSSMFTGVLFIQVIDSTASIDIYNAD